MLPCGMAGAGAGSNVPALLDEKRVQNDSSQALILMELIGGIVCLFKGGVINFDDVAELQARL